MQQSGHFPTQHLGVIALAFFTFLSCAHANEDVFSAPPQDTPGEFPAMPQPHAPQQPATPAPQPTIKPPALPSRETELPNDSTPTLGPQTLETTQKALETYKDYATQGGWAVDLPALKPSAHGEAVAKLKQHLRIEGDLPPQAPQPPSDRWDNALTAAVKHFQARMGLRQTGIVSGETRAELNVTVEERVAALQASIARLSLLHPDFSHRYVVVNLPSTAVEAVEEGRVAYRFAAIVGDPKHPSPEIAAHITEVNLNPTWTVPISIIKKEIIPHMRKDPKYLSRERIRILDAEGHQIDPSTLDWTSQRAANYILRQDSGAGNSLGSIRIDMPNIHAVYMHDTPKKNLFGRDFRFLSHGCVRVQGVYDYAAWLLQETPGPEGKDHWDKPALMSKVSTHARYDIKLAHPIPVYWVYLTGWASTDGVVHFRRDVYDIATSPPPTTPEPSQQPPTPINITWSPDAYPPHQ